VSGEDDEAEEADADPDVRVDVVPAEDEEIDEALRS